MIPEFCSNRVFYSAKLPEACPIAYRSITKILDKYGVPHEALKATKDKNGASEEKSGTSDGPAGDYDEMLPQAAEVVIEMGSCSVSMLQRRIKLGYSRAARIVDQMEELGIVGPYEGAKPRSVMIDKAGWHDLQVKMGWIPADSPLDLDPGPEPEEAVFEDQDEEF